jgi:phosphate:Na+ symporter
LSEASGPPESEDEQQRLTSTLHALDHASRLAEVVGEQAEFRVAPSGAEDLRAAELCAEAMRSAASLAGEVAALPASPNSKAPAGSRRGLSGPLAAEKDFTATGPSIGEALNRLEHCATALSELRREHRSATLSSVASGAVTADEAMARVDTVRRLEAIAHHAWRAAAHLVGRTA